MTAMNKASPRNKPKKATKNALPGNFNAGSHAVSHARPSPRYPGTAAQGPFKLLGPRPAESNRNRGDFRLTGADIMAIYADFGKIQGSVNAKGFENHIEWDSFNLVSGRHISMAVGAGKERESDKPFITEFQLSKEMDKSSPEMFLGALVGKAIDKVQIKCVKTSEDATEQYLSYTLDDVLVSAYAVSGNEGSDPYENVTLAFNKIEMKYHPRKEDNSLGDPVPAGYDVKLGKKL